MEELEAERRLAFAILERARCDLEGRYLLTPDKRYQREELLADEARDWTHDAGEEFRFWCAVAGVDWRRARRAILNGP